MTKPSERMRIGFLPFYVGYYEQICASFPQEKLALANRCADRLAAFGEVVWDHQLICDAKAAEEAGRKLAQSNISAVVVVTTIAVFANLPFTALRELTVPILLWNAQEIENVGTRYSMTEIVRNTGQIGTQALANVLTRAGRRFRVVCGFEGDSETLDSLHRFFLTLKTIAALKQAQLLLVGDMFPGMLDVELDDSYLRSHLGARVTRVSSAELTQTYQAAEEALLKYETIESTSLCEVSELTTDELERSVRLSVALDSLVKKYCADAGSLNCHLGNCLQNPSIGITACFSLGVQNNRGRPFTCTGDLPTALALLLLKKLTGVAMYTEVQVMDKDFDAVVIANSGEGEDGIRRINERSKLVGNTNFKGVNGRGASYAYALQPGPATLVSLTPTPNNQRPFRLIVAEGEILSDTLPDTGALAGFFRFQHVDLHEGYTSWIQAGPVHHAATTTGHWETELRDIADSLNFEFVGVR